MAIHNTYDHALKILARTYPKRFLELTFPGLPVQLVGTLENVELALEIDRVDFLHQIAIRGDEAFLHYDFEHTHTDPFPRRVFCYNGILTELKKPIPIISVPIYLNPRDKPIPKAYETRVGGILFHQFTYQPILLWEHIDEIRSGKLYPLAPLLVLLTKKPTRDTLIEERDLIVAHEPDMARRRTLFSTAVLTALAQQIFEPDFVWSLFKEDKMFLFDDPVFSKWAREQYEPKVAAAEAVANQEAAKRREVEAALQQERVARRRAEAAQREAKADAVWREAEAKRRIAEAEAEAKAEAKRRIAEAEAEAKRRREAEAKARAEAKRRIAEAQAEAEAEAKRRREAEAKARAAEAKQRAAETEAQATRQLEWLSTVMKFLAHRFTNVPIEVGLEVQRISARQRSQVIDLVLDAPDLATFRQQLKEMLLRKE